MNRERLGLELEIMMRYLRNPSWIATNNTGNWLYVYTGEQNFTLHICLDRFPYAPPPVLIDRMLYDRIGCPLDSSSHDRHTLQAMDGKTQICYYNPTKWVSDESLWMVYNLGVLWCQAYWKWMTTGRGTIDGWIDRIRNGVGI